ncbi:hypothetical protein A2954_00910 [Candidatus Roizmanbacteria bacterium RIFCSPLOWO2_01_FULL_37_12]|uniref:PIN domain-containing protein n=1 Tax=Candidatus Roizmanbacteria bacterium RIFCSPLOWO2_01_FULL_37_12 TaxID=1802056 RepID=A0A1F7IGA5_9BACT|nr:MAG: hypothetical protein A3D76_06910 [Candidatus Roizmanbacteria bacterium RIFCSPHIGHO2_02_FULL_37_9b]OGK42388.1 MAG: hypothetical protein A2954_00910 [Candidatus Roizmanbacteria bacterium RIFCSPLOWO2_01_FULL_37_12]
MGRTKLDSFRSDLVSFKKIGLDSMIFIYQFADHIRYAPLTHVVFELLEESKIIAVTSTITLTEVFVQPEKEKNQLIISEYEKVFQNLPNLETVPVNWQIARLSAKLRANFPKIKTPDAIQISSSLLKEYPAFLTNDQKLKKVAFLKVLILEDYL